MFFNLTYIKSNVIIYLYEYQIKEVSIVLDERVRLFKVLGDKSRIKIINSLIKEPMYVELISERLGLNPSTVSFHLKKLEHIGLVRSEKEQYYVMYYLDKQKLDFNLLKEITETATPTKTEEQREELYRRKIIDNFFVDGKLQSIPVQRKKRNVILEKIAEDFEVGKPYTEKEVNIKIMQYHDDFCTIRREFIMTRLFQRDQGIYIRNKRNID